MAAPGLDEVMAFLTEHGFASTASALRDDVLGRTSDWEPGAAAALDRSRVTPANSADCRYRRRSNPYTTQTLQITIFALIFSVITHCMVHSVHGMP